MAQTRVKNFHRLGATTIDRLAVGWAGGVSAAAGYLTNLLAGSKVFDWPSIAAAGQSTTTVTVTGAAFGDFAGCTMNIDLQAMRLTAYISAADTVTAVLTNGTAGAIDLGSGTLLCRVERVALTT